jgi:hypothetical protein
MNLKKLISALVLLSWIVGVNAQQQRFMIRVVDNHNQTLMVENATSSSSSSCNSSDFPVYHDGSRSDVNLRDLNRIIVHPDRSTKNDEIYVAVELIDRNGESSMTEMIRNIRFMGQTGDGRFSRKIEDIQTVDVVF